MKTHIFYCIILLLISCNYSCNEKKNDRRKNQANNIFVGKYFSNSNETLTINNDGSGESYIFIQYNQAKIPKGLFTWTTYFTEINNGKKLEVIRCVWENGAIADFSFWQDTKTLISFFKKDGLLKPFNAGIKRVKGDENIPSKSNGNLVFINTTPSFEITLPEGWQYSINPYDAIKLSAFSSRKYDELVLSNVNIIEGKKEHQMSEALARKTYLQIMPQAKFINYKIFNDINTVAITLKTRINDVDLGVIVYQMDSKLNSYTITFTFDWNKIDIYEQTSKDIVQSMQINDM